MPFFSVVIPTFNQSNYLKKAIESVLAQKYKNYEIIVIDNNSKDETKKVIYGMSPLGSIRTEEQKKL